MAGIDYMHLTAPCGLPCFACLLYQAQNDAGLRAAAAKELNISGEKACCRGCRSEGGACAHLPVDCRVYPCAEKRGFHNCSQCPDFPCDLLHPYADNARLWHNTKVFNLCLIKKMGLEAWADSKAREVVQTYSCDKWKL